jgi:hypothetical protein
MNQKRIRYYLAKHWPRRPLRWWQHRAISKQDVLLASYPRSGNTWLRFLLYECVTGQTADFVTINDPYSPIADFPHFQKAPVMTAVQGRIIKTHESFRHEYGRAIHLLRDPRAVAVSEYHYLRGYDFYRGTLAAFVEDFVKGKVNGYGAWHWHTASWLQATGADVVMVRYEDLKHDSWAVLAHIADFLGLDIGKEQLQQVVAHNSVQAMQWAEERTAVLQFADDKARFVRQGQAHIWRSELDDAQISLIEREMGDVMVQLGYELVTV